MVKVHQCDFFVNKSGTGKWIVLLHGWGQSHQQMAFLQQFLSEKYCVVNMDLPGFGKSEEPPFAWSIEQYSDALNELLKKLGCDEPLIIAHSFGARIALRYAYKYACQGLILTGAAGIKEKRTLQYYVKVYTYKFCKRFGLGQKMGSKDYQNASKVMKEVLVKSVNDDLTPLLSSIQVPALLVWGKQDDTTPLWMGKKMEECMPNAHFICIEGDHFAYLNNQRFLKIVEAYVKEALS